MRVRALGFTLIELMIVVAIIAIIAAIAVPSYENQMQKTRRTDGTAALLQARQGMERHYSKNYTYLGAAAGTAFIAKAPIDGNDTFYNLTLDAVTATGFTITATPVNAQQNDSCGALGINQAGAKGAKGSAPGSTAAGDIDECWR